MPEHAALLDVLRRFARTMTHRYDLTETLHDFCDHAAEVVSATGAGVALLDGDKLRFVTATNPTITAAEHAQEELQTGPCMASIHRRAPVRVPDLRERADEWPEYCRQVTGHGLHAALGIPLVLDDDRIGSLDIYDREPREWSDDEVNAAVVLADIAAAYVLNANELAATRRTTEQLQHALDSRVVIEQAKGVLAGQRDLLMPDAFEVIRHHARNNNRTVRSVSQQIIDEGIDFLET